MLYKHIEGTGLIISKNVLGCRRIVNMQVKDLEKLVDKAFHLGINFFDHVDIWGRKK